MTHIAFPFRRPRAAAAAILAAAGLAAASAAQAQTPAWSAMGSTGIVDESGYNPPKFVFTNGGAFVKPNPDGSQTVTLRYNIGALPFTVGTFSQPMILLRYRDNSTKSAGGGHIQVVLKGDNIDTGLGNLNMSTFNSDNFPADDSTQEQVMSTCGINWDFAHDSYYFEVTITQDNAKDPNASIYLQQIRIVQSGICTP